MIFERIVNRKNMKKSGDFFWMICYNQRSALLCRQVISRRLTAELREHVRIAITDAQRKKKGAHAYDR